MDGCGYTEKIGAYHDGELSDGDARAFEEHLAHCEDCARGLQALRSLSALLGAVEIPDAPAWLLERVRREAVGAGERVVMRMMEVLTAAAAVIFIVCCGWVWGGGQSSDTTTAPAAWEQAAITGPLDSSTSATDEVALWIVADLSLENGHD
jgi:anti-sigma factor RsiW